MLSIFDYIEAWYNPQRIHSKIGDLSLNKFEKIGLDLSGNNVKIVNNNLKTGAMGLQV